MCGMEMERFADQDPTIIFLPEIPACRDCGKKPCSNGVGSCCIVQGRSAVKALVDAMLEADNIVFVTPVYLNAPTPKVLAFLSRINSYNDVAGRDLFQNQTAYITAVADVSGTQQTISIMMSALGLLGFKFPSKGNREHILEWKTGKIRGGNLKEKTLYLENRGKGGNE